MTGRHPRLRWKARIRPHGVETRPASSGQLLYAASSDGSLIALDLATGAIRDRRHVLHGVSSVLGIDGRIVFLVVQLSPERSKVLCAYDLERDSLRWTVPVGLGSLSLVARDGLAWSAGSDGLVHALDTQDGRSRWTHRTRSGRFSRALLALAGELLFVAGAGRAGFEREGYLVALDAATGDLRWCHAANGQIYGPPAICPELVLIGDSGRPWAVEALEIAPPRALGKPRWRSRLDGMPGAGTVDGELVIWGCYNGHVEALSLATGEPLWRFHAGAHAGRNAPHVRAGWVFVGGADGYLYGLDARSGMLRWKYHAFDEEAMAAAEHEAAREPDAPPADPEREEREARESEAYRGKRRDDELPAVPRVAPPDVATWSEGGLLYLVTSRGLLHAFELPCADAGSGAST